MVDFAGWAYSQITITGPDPFSSDASANSSAPGNSTITINSGETPTLISMTDGDSNFSEGDSDQRYQGPADFNGGDVSGEFNVGDRIETEYSYIIRPQGSSDPADNVTIYMLEIDADGQGFAADGQLLAGVTYDIISIDSNNPVVPYSNLFVCFASGTRIATPFGPRPVEALDQGDPVDTLDNGVQAVRWIGRRTLTFEPGPHSCKPILFPKGSLGPDLPKVDLKVSPQHRMMVQSPGTRLAEKPSEVLALAKGLLPLPGVREMRGCKRITYHSLLLDRHEILLAEGTPTESFYPGPFAMSLLTPRQRNEIYSIFPALAADPENGYGPKARPHLTRREAMKLSHTLRAETRAA